MFTLAAENADRLAEATRVHVVSAAIVRAGRILLAQRAFELDALTLAIRSEPLVNVRASGDAGHEDGCVRDHVLPGVCVTGGEEGTS